MDSLETSLKQDSPKQSGHIYIKESQEITKEVAPQKSLASIKDGLGSFMEKAKDIKNINSRKNFGPSKKSNPFVRSLLQKGWERSIVALTDAREKIKKKQLAKRTSNLLLMSIRKIPIAFSKTGKGITSLFRFFAIWLRKFRLVHPTMRQEEIPRNIEANHKIKRIADKIKQAPTKQKVYALLILVLIFVVPIFIVRLENKMSSSQPTEPDINISDNTSPNPAPQEESSDRIDFSPLKSLPDAIGIAEMNGKSFLINKSSITEIGNDTPWTVPGDFGNIARFTKMDDLNLLFLMNNQNRTISFSPTSQKFQENALNLPENSEVKALGTFMTYLYVFDSKNNQVYRYPRAEGGFGEKTDWLKESADLSKYSDISLTDGVFFFGQGGYAKFFRGKKEELSLDNLPSTQKIDWLFAQEDAIFILDRNSKTITQFNPDGSVARKISSEKLDQTSQFLVSEDKKYIRILLPDGEYSASL